MLTQDSSRTDASPHRRKVRTPKIIAIAAGLAILLLAGATVSLWTQLSRAHSDASLQASRIATLTGQVRDISTQNTNLSKMTEALHGELRAFQEKVANTVGDLSNPHFALWNSCGAFGPTAGCLLTPGHEYVVGVPDTFTYFVSFRSTVPVTVWIMSTSNFVCRETHNCAWHAWGWQNRTNLVGGVFHNAEGCAGYLAVFFSARAGILYPDVSVTRNPASHSTGACGV